MSSFSELSVASPTSQLILQPFPRFTYVTAHSPTLPLLHLRHSSFSNPSFASPTLQDFHLHHVASRPCSIWWSGYASTISSSFYNSVLSNNFCKYNIFAKWKLVERDITKMTSSMHNTFIVSGKIANIKVVKHLSH